MNTNFIVIDTEFSRDRTYNPMLSIVQIQEYYDNVIHEIKIFDILDKSEQNINNIEYLKFILQNDNIVKIGHSLKQDIEAIYYHFKFIIKNIFDTQIAAKALNIKNEISYVDLVNLLLNKNITKSKNLQYSKWLKRPLTTEQIIYAKQDVEFLFELYEKLIFSLENHENKDKFYNYCTNLTDITNYIFNPLTSWKSTYIYRLNNLQAHKLKQLWILREKIAYSKNVPKNRVIHQKDLFELINNDINENSLEKSQIIQNILNKLPKFVDKNEFIKILNFQ